MLFEVSAPGKVILCGEHSVVYGRKAFASAVNLRTFITVSKADQNSNEFIINFNDIKGKSIKITEHYFKQLKGEVDYSIDDKLLSAINFLISSLTNSGGLSWNSLNELIMNVRSEIPLASGLGSSASLCVAMTASFLILSKQIDLNNSKKDFDCNDLKLINSYSFQLENIFHGKASGLDNSISTYGHFIVFGEGKIIDKFNIKDIDPLIQNLSILIIDSNVTKSTKKQVEKVKLLHHKYENILNHIFEAIDLIVDQFIDTFKGSTSSFELISTKIDELININQGLLTSIGTSHSKLDDIIKIANDFDYSCKLTGAGGGGCAYIPLKTSNDDLISNLTKHNFKSFTTKFGSSGVKIEKFNIF
jgi:mevalonate kinase